MTSVCSLCVSVLVQVPRVIHCSLSSAVLTIVHYALSALLSFTILHYALAFASMVLLYVFYTQPDDCTEHKVVISLNLLFSILVSIVAILPKVQVIPIPVRAQ